MSIKILTSLFPLWAIIASLTAWFLPEPLVRARPAITPLLGIIMLSMGLTLTWKDFSAVTNRPLAVTAGVILQYVFMPLSAWLISMAMGLTPEVMAGMVLVGACPGGTASNVICFLAAGDVALSISLTACSTILSIVATPLLTLLYAGRTVPVPAAGMLTSICKIVLLPVILGVMINSIAGPRLRILKQILPLLSVISIVTIIGIIVALNHNSLSAAGWSTGMAVMAHNLSGLAAGYLLPWCAGWDSRTCRTIAIETGMQNSGLAVALAIKYFSAAAALPGALFSIWHNLSGSLMALLWSRASHKTE